jgi:hypothetical protein
MKTYARKNFETLWKDEEQDWAGVVIQKKMGNQR